MTPGKVVKNIKAGMAYIGASSEDMAKCCKVSRSTWFRWMRSPEVITLPYLFIIAARLGIEPEELLKEREGASACLSLLLSYPVR